MCTLASIASCRAARMIESRAAIGPEQPVPTRRPVWKISTRQRGESKASCTAANLGTRTQRTIEGGIHSCASF